MPVFQAAGESAPAFRTGRETTETRVVPVE